MKSRGNGGSFIRLVIEYVLHSVFSTSTFQVPVSSDKLRSPKIWSLAILPE